MKPGLGGGGTHSIPKGHTPETPCCSRDRQGPARSSFADLALIPSSRREDLGEYPQRGGGYPVGPVGIGCQCIRMDYTPIPYASGRRTPVRTKVNLSIERLRHPGSPGARRQHVARGRGRHCRGRSPRTQPALAGGEPRGARCLCARGRARRTSARTLPQLLSHGAVRRLSPVGRNARRRSANRSHRPRRDAHRGAAPRGGCLRALSRPDPDGRDRRSGDGSCGCRKSPPCPRASSGRGSDRSVMRGRR